MMNLFDEKTGYLLLDEIVFERESFQRIIEDNLITDEEVIKQANTVIKLLKELNEKLDEDEKAIVIDAISEMAVLYQINALKGGRQ